MCAQFYIAEEDAAEELLLIIEALNRRANGDPPVKCSGVCYPKEMIAVVANAPSLKPNVYPMQWGYTAPNGKLLFNARSETAAQKPTFRDGFSQRRCLIPATGYYEWQKHDAGKTKYAIDTGSSMIWLAGIYRIEGNRAACSILTRDPSAEIAFIHDRMPVILPREALADWLDIRSDPQEILKTAQTTMRYQAV